jgi:hypothetical protein
LGLIRIWFGGTGSVTTYLGILTAGIAIALADVLENLAGWVFIVTRRPFRIGDRVEVENKSGDVVTAFRFSMLEIGNWVDAISRPAASSTYPTARSSPSRSPTTRRALRTSGTRSV